MFANLYDRGCCGKNSARDRDWRGGEAVRKGLRLAAPSNGAERRNPEKPDGFREAETVSP
ncbi:hypothetical protein [Treponema parvum]|uniref:hypothetical protein n=1 Tax=Treponema parvum TaxID=138851 RepID=UPI001AEBB029|nr:hypothetical protein [Treponema parvum]QTQ15702.1 hypothetical protein HXT04_02725 [Treponema parvum]